jgi:hypothetical protein
MLKIITAFLFIITYTRGFWRAKRPCAARTHLSRLINTLNDASACPAPPSPINASLLYSLFGEIMIHKVEKIREKCQRGKKSSNQDCTVKAAL